MKPTQPTLPNIIPDRLTWHWPDLAAEQERVRRARAEREAREAAQALREKMRRNEAERGRGNVG